jgi:hypothetical protein
MASIAKLGSLTKVQRIKQLVLKQLRYWQTVMSRNSLINVTLQIPKVVDAICNLTHQKVSVAGYKALVEVMLQLTAAVHFQIQKQAIARM